MGLAICDRYVSDIIKRSIVKVKRCERLRFLEVSQHSLRVGAVQASLIKGYELVALIRNEDGHIQAPIRGARDFRNTLFEISINFIS
jgi:hypothetical protein